MSTLAIMGTQRRAFGTWSKIKQNISVRAGSTSVKQKKLQKVYVTNYRKERTPETSAIAEPRAPFRSALR